MSSEDRLERDCHNAIAKRLDTIIELLQRIAPPKSSAWISPATVTKPQPTLDEIQEEIERKPYIGKGSITL